MACPRCGNNLAAGAAFCSVCGHSLAAGGPYGAAPRAVVPVPQLSGMAVLGFILAFLFPPVGLALSIIGRSEIQKSQGRLEGSGFALAGIVISIIAMVLTILTFVFVLAVFHELFSIFH